MNEFDAEILKCSIENLQNAYCNQIETSNESPQSFGDFVDNLVQKFQMDEEE